MANIYDIRRYGKITFLVIVVVVVAIFLYFFNNLVKDLSQQERQRMEIWADATKEMITQQSGTDVDFLFSIINRNTTIPVLLTDDDDNILSHSNFTLPEPIDSLNPMYLSEANEAYLRERLEDLRNSSNVIHIEIDEGSNQHLYYEDSTLLKQLNY